VALLIRQVFAFLSLIFQSKDVERVLQHQSKRDQLAAINFNLIFRNDDIRSRLAVIRLNQWALFVPMMADLAGIVFAVCGLLIFNISWWSWVGLVCFLVYELIMFGLVIGATQSAREVRSSFGKPKEGQEKTSL
jgi:Co/Zn/Cd efflux system component